MTLYLIGLGLGGKDDITVKGLNAVKGASKVYIEAYTSVLIDCSREELEELYGKPIEEADRETVECFCDRILEEAKTMKVAFLVVGDPFGATTHSDLYMRAVEMKVEVVVIHNASIMNAIGCTGLQLYRFGQTVSVPFFDGNWQPRSFVDRISENLRADLHTLVLLDIKVKEQTVENMMKRSKVYEPPRFMSIHQAIQQILHFETESECNIDTKAIGVARVGSTTQCVRSGTLKELLEVDFGGPLHSLIICAPSLHEMEQAFYSMYRC